MLHFTQLQHYSSKHQCYDLMLMCTVCLLMLFFPIQAQVDAGSKTLQQRASTQLEHEIACLSLNPAANTAIKTTAATAAAASSSSSAAEAGEDAMAVVEEPEVLVHQPLHTPCASSILCTINRARVTSTCCCLHYYAVIIIRSLSKLLEPHVAH
jgi:hypothetical protein